jgi:response regulator RpfG family c-di-GMP phosphodiesterase
MAENEFKTANLTYPKVIMLTAKDDPELKNTLYREKLIHGFFNKPVPIDILEDKIREILKIQPPKISFEEGGRTGENLVPFENKAKRG